MTVLKMNRVMKEEGLQVFVERMVCLKDRFMNYLAENSSVIVPGLLALSGNTSAYRTYLMLKEER